MPDESFPDRDCIRSSDAAGEIKLEPKEEDRVWIMWARVCLSGMKPIPFLLLSLRELSVTASNTLLLRQHSSMLLWLEEDIGVEGSFYDLGRGAGAGRGLPAAFLPARLLLHCPDQEIGERRRKRTKMVSARNQLHPR